MLISELEAKLKYMRERHGDGNVSYVENYDPSFMANNEHLWINNISYQAVSGIGCTIVLSNTILEKK